MAGDWIAWTKGLSRKREVLAIAERTGRDRRQVACLLMEFWEWADGETEDGFLAGMSVRILSASHADTDETFWRQVADVGWLVIKDDGVLIPRFARWMGTSAKRRLNDTNRKRQTRRDDVRNLSASNADKLRTERGPEKRREESNKKPPFIPPCVDEVAAYCRERNNRVDAESFVSHYQSNGWKVGKNPMRDWRAAVRTWEKNDRNGAFASKNGNGADPHLARFREILGDVR